MSYVKVAALFEAGGTPQQQMHEGVRKGELGTCGLLLGTCFLHRLQEVVPARNSARRRVSCFMGSCLCLDAYEA
jgi:hypothetical protein